MKILFRLSSVAFVATLAVTLFIFIALPTRGVESILIGRLGVNATKLHQYYAFLLFASVLANLGMYLLRDLLKRLIHTAPDPLSKASPRAISTARFALLIQILLAGLILFQAVRNIEAPFDWDENEYAGLLLKWDSRLFNPMQSSNHPIASLGAYASMQIFGASKAASRVPAVLLTAVLLFALILWGRNFLSPLTIILILSHLAFNQMFLWYTHSFRGYLPLVLFTGIAGLMAIEFAKNPERKWGRSRSLVFLSCLLGAILSHGFGGIFCMTLLLSLLIWSFTNREQYSPAAHRTALQISLLCLACIPLYLFMGVSHVFIWDKLNFLFFWQNPADETPGMYFNEFNRLFGLSRLWCLKLIGVFFILTVALRMHARKGISKDFAFVFLCVGSVVNFCVWWLLDSNLFQARYVFPLLIFFVAVVSESIVDTLSGRVRNALLAGYLLLFAMAPLWNGKAVYNSLSLGLLDFQVFADRVRAATAPVAAQCYVFDGNPHEVRWSKSFYFQEARSSGCSSRYYVWLSEKAVAADFLPASSREILADGKGRKLFLAEDNPPLHSTYFPSDTRNARHLVY